MATPNQSNNEIILTKMIAEHKESSTFSIVRLNTALKQIRTLNIQPKIKCMILGDLFFEWTADAQLPSGQPKELLIEICDDYLLARTEISTDKNLYLKMPTDAEINSLVEDFINNHINFDKWSPGNIRATDMPMQTYIPKS